MFLVILDEVGYIYVWGIFLSGEHAVSVISYDRDTVDSSEDYQIAGLVIITGSVRVFQDVQTGELVEGKPVIIGAVKGNDTAVAAYPDVLLVVADDSVGRSLGYVLGLMEGLVFWRINDKSVSCGDKYLVSACYVECLIDCQTAAGRELYDTGLAGLGVVFENTVLSAAEPYGGVVRDC